MSDLTDILLFCILLVLSILFVALVQIKQAIEDNTDWHIDNYGDVYEDAEGK